MGMPHPLRFGIKSSGQDTTTDALRAIWRIADQARFDHVWVFDHLASIGEGGPGRPVFEGWSLQAAIAVATEHVRLGCLVTGNTYRNPALLAKIAVTVDHLSGGRLEFGIGAAWAQVEHEMYGIEGLDHRVGRDPSTIRRSVQYSWNGNQRSELLDTAGDWVRRGFTEHIIILPPADAERVASLAAEALGDLRSLRH